MMIEKISSEEFGKDLAAALATRDKARVNVKELSEAIKEIQRLKPDDEECVEGYRVFIYDEAEINDLLGPFLRSMEIPMVGLVVVSRSVAVSALTKLAVVRSNTAFTLLIPQDKERDAIDLSFIPVKRGLRARYAIDGLAEYLFKKQQLR